MLQHLYTASVKIFDKTMASKRRKPNRVEVYLTDSDKQLLNEISEQTGFSKTEVLRQCLLIHGEQFRSRQAKDSLQGWLVA